MSKCFEKSEDNDSGEEKELENVDLIKHQNNLWTVEWHINLCGSAYFGQYRQGPTG
jgi:hypothetical protein